jgi:drug/metabolite transporter (DMT)-like permease
MTTFGLVLVLAAACCHATWNFFVKRMNGGPELVWLFSVVSVVVYLPAAVYALALNRTPFGPWELLFFAGSVVLHLAYFLLLQRAYKTGDLSLVYPTARATGPFLSTIFAVIFLGNPISLQIACGGAAIIIGVLGLTGGFRARAGSVLTSVSFGLATGCLIASYTIWDSYAVSAMMISPLLLDYASGFGRAILLTPIAAKRWTTVKSHWQDNRMSVMIIAIFNPLAYMLVLYALVFTPVVYVAPTREVSVLITVILGSVLLGEGDLRRRFAWAVLITGGVAFLATA